MNTRPRSGLISHIARLLTLACYFLPAAFVLNFRFRFYTGFDSSSVDESRPATRRQHEIPTKAKTSHDWDNKLYNPQSVDEGVLLPGSTDEAFLISSTIRDEEEKLEDEEAGNLQAECATSASPPRPVSVHRASFPTSAAQGGVWYPLSSAGGLAYLAVANFYGDSELLRFDTLGGEVGHVQYMRSECAHDWEAFIPQRSDRTVLLLGANFCGSESYAYVDATDSSTDSVKSSYESTTVGLLPCQDSPAKSNDCQEWASHGECDRNPSFMRSTCPRSCGVCAKYNGPLIAIQRLKTDKSAAVQHMRMDGGDSLAVADSSGVKIYKYQYTSASEADKWTGAGRFELFQEIQTVGVAELGSCQLAGDISESREGGPPITFLATATWFKDGSFVSRSEIYASVGGASFSLVQSVPSAGAHDWECFHIGHETFLGLANVRDDHSQLVDSVIYRHQWTNAEMGTFEVFQRIPTAGAHDLEVFVIGDRTYLAISNQGNDMDCSSGGVMLYVFHPEEDRFLFLSQIATGCATYSKHLATTDVQEGEQHYLAVMIERVESDDSGWNYNVNSSIHQVYGCDHTCRVSPACA